MPPKAKLVYLWDIQKAVQNLKDFTQNKNLADYEANIMLRAAVERQFQIIGEAFSQALKFYPELTLEISNTKQIISFRNQLIHAYANIDDSLVWGVIQDDLPLLSHEVKVLIKEND